MPRIGIGWGLSRRWRDVHGLPGGRTSRSEDTSAGIAARAAEIARTSLVLFEATGGDAPLVAALAGRGIAVARGSPRQSREVARACGGLTGTDRAGWPRWACACRSRSRPRPTPSAPGPPISCAAAGR